MRTWRGLRRPTRRTLIGVAAAAVAVAGLGAHAVISGRTPSVRTETLRVPVGAEADGTPVSLDATLYLPAGADRKPAPAVLLAHGFGGSKQDLDGDARDLARHGYVALAYSARGFGASGGLIHLDAPAYEVADAAKLIDLLAARPEVLKDAPGDPRVGVAGASYGGGLTLMAAGTDRRIDAIAPQITWNDLGTSLFGQTAGRTGGAAPTTPAGRPGLVGTGVLKKAWAGYFFGSGSAPATATPGSATAVDPGGPEIPSGPGGSAAATSLACGRFAPDLCAQYQTAAATGVVTPELATLLAASSPAGVITRVTAPTLLIQGEADSLFPLSEADANARGIAANGTPVKVVWYGGGHDAPGGSTEQDQLRTLTLTWFDRYLKHDGSAPDTAFQFAESGTGISLQDGTVRGSTLKAPAYPGLSGPGGAPAGPPVGTTEVALTGRPQPVVAPAGGFPATITSLPGLGGLLSQLTSSGLAGAGGGGIGGAANQDATFESRPLAGLTRVVGSPAITLHITSTAPDATLFAKLYDVSPDGRQAILPKQLAAPIRLTGIPDGGTDVRVALPAVVHTFAAGHRMRLVVSTTDQAYQLPATPRVYEVALAGSGSGAAPASQSPTAAAIGTAQLTLPLVPAAAAGGSAFWLWTLAGLAVALVLAAVAAAVARRRRSGRDADVDADLVDVPVAITHLGKAYRDGFRAVSDLSFRIEPGQVLGLLGPNGAGKTTTLRMLVGLIQPSEGAIHVYGHRITPGAPVLSRVGAFIEGPGFLPHLSGRDNLTLYWAATGRPAEDAGFAAALELAGLGADVDRRVRTYSQGMRQRLAVAQAMLGLPDLLVLDEPTNGLDPPQIREMREALKRYAATGRTVVVSSHLLAEVEQTCTHVVVMHRGRLLAAGPVAELIGAAASVAMQVDDVDAAVKVLGGLAGVRAVATPDDGALVLELAGIRPGAAVAALVGAGVSVDRVAPRHQLEDVFLTLVNEGEPV